VRARIQPKAAEFLVSQKGYEQSAEEEEELLALPAVSLEAYDPVKSKKAVDTVRFIPGVFDDSDSDELINCGPPQDLLSPSYADGESELQAGLQVSLEGNSSSDCEDSDASQDFS
jgi:hypothetical protein